MKAVGKANERCALELEVKELTDNVGQGLKESEDFNVEDGYFWIKSEEGTESEQSKAFIPTLGVVATTAVIMGLYLVIMLRRRK